jgi:threonine dehydratase
VNLRERIEAADRRIRPHARETPLIHSPALSELAGAEIYLKLENLQRTGSFKVRGALNKLLSLPESDRRRGVITASTGNHGAATAFAAGKVGVRVTVYVPHTASTSKVDRIRRLGAAVEFHGEDSGRTEIYARQVAEREGKCFVSPYNDLEIVAGQGTIGVELLRQEPSLDAAVIALGGGGLLGGIATYLKAVKPASWIVGCSPRNSAVMIQSIEQGAILDLPSSPTLSDGTAGGVEPGAITFDLCRDSADEYDLVDEDEIAEAMRLLYQEERLVVEGAAGVALASALHRRERLAGKKVAVLLCGGNLGWDVVAKVWGLGPESEAPVSRAAQG